VLIKWFEQRLHSRAQTFTGTENTFTSSEKSDVIVDGSHHTELELARRRYRIPAVNIEHHVERLGAFVRSICRTVLTTHFTNTFQTKVTIILGEMVVNVFFSTDLASGLNMCVRMKFVLVRKIHIEE
jgi:hypothetical protein